MSKYILALDAGTTSSRSILVNQSGAIVAVAQREFAQHFPQPGWVEHDANEIWSTQRATIEEVLSQAGATAKDIAAVGITNQRETTVLWDRRTSEPLARAIVWQDRRTAERCSELKALGSEPWITARTGLLLDPYFSATKLAWLLERTPNARARATNGELAFGTIDSWLAFKLSSGRHHITDVSNASRTLLLNLASAKWDDESLRLFDIPAACLPNIVPTANQTTVVNIQGMDLTLAAIVGDQQAALFGQGCHSTGSAKLTFGTGCFLLVNTGGRVVQSQHRLLSTAAWQRAGHSTQYALEGSVFMGGAVIQWLRDGLGLIDKTADIEALADSVPDNGGVYFVPAFTGMGCPYWDPSARGSIQGLTRGVTGAHIARAALEAIAFQSADLLEAAKRDLSQPLTDLRVDGGAAANNLLLQFQADLLDVPVLRPKVLETTALGAAHLAGIAVGFWESEAEVARHWQIDRRFEPQMSRDQVAQLRGQWSRAVDRARGWAG